MSRRDPLNNSFRFFGFIKTGGIQLKYRKLLVITGGYYNRRYF